MKPTDFPEKNAIFDPPVGVIAEPLNAFVDKANNQMILKYELSEDDLERIKTGKCVWLFVSGGNLPPLHLSTEYPFKPKQEPAPATASSKIILLNPPGEIIK